MFYYDGSLFIKPPKFSNKKHVGVLYIHVYKTMMEHSLAMDDVGVTPMTWDASI